MSKLTDKEIEERRRLIAIGNKAYKYFGIPLDITNDDAVEIAEKKIREAEYNKDGVKRSRQQRRKICLHYRTKIKSYIANEKRKAEAEKIKKV